MTIPFQFNDMISECIACKSHNCLNIFREKDTVLKCNNCNAIFGEKPVAEDFFNRKDGSNIKTVDKMMSGIRSYSAKLYADEYVRYLKSKTKMNFRNALDIGASYGYFVKELNKWGVDSDGIESVQSVVNLAVSKKVKWAFFNELFNSEKKYDLICLTQMIYYFRRNYEILEHVREMLSNDGLIFITTINPESSLTNELKDELPLIGTNMILSRKNFEALTIGLEMVDYSTYRSNVSFDFHMGNKYTAFLKYKLGLRQPLIPDQEGNFAFVLLKRTNLVSI